MKKQTLFRLVLAGALVGGAALAGCSVNGTGTPPIGVPNAPLANLGTLQLAVGVASVTQATTSAAVPATIQTTGTNFVATFRQANGDSATLVNTPTLAGPAPAACPNVLSWCVAAAANPNPGTDAGTNKLTGIPQQLQLPTPAPDTFVQSGGVFSYGFAPDNTNTSGSAIYTAYSMPFFSTTSNARAFLTFRGAPPAYWFFDDGTWPNQQNGLGFRGFSQGFLDVLISPIAGSYSLSDLVQSGNAGSATYTASATLSNTTAPPLQPFPTITSESGGGLTGSITIPVATATFPFVETMVYVQDASTGYFYSAGPIKATGVQTFTVPGNLGPCLGGPGCQNTSAATATFTTNDTLRLYAVTYDYPMFESSSGDGPSAMTPVNTSMTPTIVGSTGQADISVSAVSTVAY